MHATHKWLIIYNCISTTQTHLLLDTYPRVDAHKEAQSIHHKSQIIEFFVEKFVIR